jgi:nucleotide-binding universal stress UspA family protein/HSP20 family molecular chaperone IbpA
MTGNQVLPVRVYQTEGRIMLTAPMPGLEPEDITVRIDGTRVVVHGEERGPHQREVPLVIAEWAIGPYHRELDLSEPVDGTLTNATYGNGVLVLSMPKAAARHAPASAEFRLISTASGRGERVGHVGRDAVAQTVEQHWHRKHDAPMSAAARPAASVPRPLYRRVLVPLDGSAEAEAILPLAEALVDIEQGDLILVRVLLPATPIAFPDAPVPMVFEATQEAERESSEYLNRLAAAMADHGVRVQVLTPSGDPARSIIHTARDLDAGLIAMTTHGRSGIGRLVFGSVAESVVREAPVPVLLMRASGSSGAASRAA